MKYRHLEYDVVRVGPTWKWSIKQYQPSPASGGLAASERTAVQSAKLAIDKIAKHEVEEIKAKLCMLNGLLACINQHVKRMAALRQHGLAEGKVRSRPHALCTDRALGPPSWEL